MYGTLSPIAMFLTLMATASVSSAKEILIIQKGKQFLEAETGKPVAVLEVNLKDVIKFKNDDEITHNIYSISKGNEFELKVQKPGETGEVIVDPKRHRPGKMQVECAIHPNMKLDVSVKK
jgi:plastocyanin